MIILENIKREYLLGGEKWTFGPVSFSISSSESLCIVGPSGSGKSTLLHLIGALDKETSGVLLMNDIEISNLSTDEKNKYRKENIGFIFQDFHLFPELTVYENIKISLDLQNKFSSGEKEKKIMKVLEQTGIAEKFQHFPHQLSGGQQQRVAIARAIVHSPKLLLADEPTGNLDAKTGETIINLLFRLKKENNMGFWCVTHDQKLAQQFSQVLEIEDGKIKKNREIKIKRRELKGMKVKR